MKTVLLLQPVTNEFEEARKRVSEAIAKAGASLLELGPARKSSELIHEALATADIIVCDISGNNPNIMYELGIAHALKRPVIVISDEPGRVPLDIRPFQVLYYDFDDMDVDENFHGELPWLIGEALKNPQAYSQTPKPLSDGNTVFISYSHKDETFLHRLMVHLRPLEKRGLCKVWADTRVEAGDDWKEEIESALLLAQVAVLLISADFLASDFIVDNELPPLLARAAEEGTRIVPVILKPCGFDRDVNLSRFQAINAPDRPLINLPEGDREALYNKVADIVDRSFSLQVRSI